MLLNKLTPTLLLLLSSVSAFAPAEGSNAIAYGYAVETAFYSEGAGTTRVGGKTTLDVGRDGEFLRIGVIEGHAPEGPDSNQRRSNARLDWFFEYGEHVGTFHEGLFYGTDPGFMPPASLGMLWTMEGLYLTRDGATNRAVLDSMLEIPADATFTVGDRSQSICEYVIQNSQAFSHGTSRLLHRQERTGPDGALELSMAIREVTLTDGRVLRIPLVRNRVDLWEDGKPAAISSTEFKDPVKETQLLHDPDALLAGVEAEDPLVLEKKTTLSLIHADSRQDVGGARIEGFLERIVAYRENSNAPAYFLDTKERPASPGQDYATFDTTARSFVVRKK